MTAQAMTPEALIERLVGFDTTSRDSNLELIHFVRDYLDEHDVEAALIHDESGSKANLFATLGPARDGGVVLSGHTDVVPVDGQEWHTDPWALTEKDGRLYGRGTVDMKGFCAIALAFAPEFLSRHLETPIHYAFSFDEEVSRVGVTKIIDGLDGFPIRPAMCIVGEPSEMRVVVAHKGGDSLPLVRDLLTGPGNLPAVDAVGHPVVRQEDRGGNDDRQRLLGLPQHDRQVAVQQLSEEHE